MPHVASKASVLQPQHSGLTQRDRAPEANADDVAVFDPAGGRRQRRPAPTRHQSRAGARTARPPSAATPQRDSHGTDTRRSDTAPHSRTTTTPPTRRRPQRRPRQPSSRRRKPIEVACRRRGRRRPIRSGRDAGRPKPPATPTAADEPATLDAALAAVVEPPAAAAGQRRSRSTAARWHAVAPAAAVADRRSHRRDRRRRHRHAGCAAIAAGDEPTAPRAARTAPQAPVAASRRPQAADQPADGAAKADRPSRRRTGSAASTDGRATDRDSRWPTSRRRRPRPRTRRRQRAERRRAAPPKPKPAPQTPQTEPPSTRRSRGRMRRTTPERRAGRKPRSANSCRPRTPTPDSSHLAHLQTRPRFRPVGRGDRAGIAERRRFQSAGVRAGAARKPRGRDRGARAGRQAAASRSASTRRSSAASTCGSTSIATATSPRAWWSSGGDARPAAPRRAPARTRAAGCRPEDLRQRPAILAARPGFAERTTADDAHGARTLIADPELPVHRSARRRPTAVAARRRRPRHPRLTSRNATWPRHPHHHTRASTAAITVRDQQRGEPAQIDNNTLAGNFQTFLTLLTTQLKNQNPLDPLDTNQFTQQLVQFAQVEQQIKQNDQLETLVALQQGGADDHRARLCRHDRRGRRRDRGADEPAGDLDLQRPEAGRRATVTIKNATGQTVYTGTFSMNAGTQTFVWDGRDANGVQWPDGNYTISITGQGRQRPDVAIPTEVQGVGRFRRPHQESAGAVRSAARTSRSTRSSASCAQLTASSADAIDRPAGAVASVTEA